MFRRNIFDRYNNIKVEDTVWFKMIKLVKLVKLVHPRHHLRPLRIISICVQQITTLLFLPANFKVPQLKLLYFSFSFQLQNEIEIRLLPNCLVRMYLINRII